MSVQSPPPPPPPVVDVVQGPSVESTHHYNNNIGIGSSESWPEDADFILENIRCNSIILSEYHKSQYFFLLSRLKYFRIPIIIISAFASVFNIGLQPFMDQGYISVLCCMLSLVTGLIGSIELFLQVQKKMENELMNSRDFYLNAIDIYKVLSLEPKHRNGDGLKYLDGKFAMYCKMIENSNVLDKSIQDQLAPIDLGMVERISSGNASKQGDEPPSSPEKSRKNSVYKNISTNNMEYMKKTNANKASVLDNFLAYFFHRPSFPIYNHDKHTTNNTNNVSSDTSMITTYPTRHNGLVEKKEEDDTISVNTDDRFDIYCTLLQHADKIDKEIIRKISPILSQKQSNHHPPQYELSLEERMKIYSYLQENIDILGGESDLLDKMKLLLVGDFFQKKKIYTSMIVLDKIKTILNIPPSPHTIPALDIPPDYKDKDVECGNIGHLIPLSETLRSEPLSNTLSNEPRNVVVSLSQNDVADKSKMFVPGVI